MTAVVTVPPSLDEASCEPLFEQLARHPEEERLLLDARHARWASPYGLVTLLCVAQARPARLRLAVPEAAETASYWARMGFFRHAAELFELHGSVPRGRDGHDSDVLLEVTPIVHSDDVHAVVGRIQSKAVDILHRRLGHDAAITGGFGMTLSEACQNIVEHAGTGGWVAVQTYNYARRLGRRVVQIAVCDAGVGFRRSLESAPGHRRTDRWDDGAALQDAVIRAVSRFRHGDAGRGQGLAGIRRFLGRWHGLLTVRSGTARLAIAPSGWEGEVPVLEGLAPFPGAQLQLTIPEALREAGEAGAGGGVPARPRGRRGAP
jgi:hypothetical protein